MVDTSRNSFQFLWRSPVIGGQFRSGVSLHSHTMYSQESLEMVPRYTAKVPYLGRAVQAKHQKNFSFENAFWTPPLAPRQAYRLEEKQIQRKLKLPALISLTDHDDIRAAAQLRVIDRFKTVPVSTEWTIPFGETFFHLGIHNMPASDAASLMNRLAEFTRHPKISRLHELFDALHSNPDILLVLNHPLWDEKGIGFDRHSAALQSLLAGYGNFLHALEVNGLRAWHENKQVIALGRETGLPVVSGGDRHGREPNAILNLSRAATFAEFVHEVRHERFSHVVFMPQYREPLKMRILQTIVDVVREYPENFAGRRYWGDRMFYRDAESGAITPLASLWKDGGPGIVKQFIGAMRLLEWRPFRSALKVALHDRSVVWSDGEAAI
jgi:hypothetical protein